MGRLLATGKLTDEARGACIEAVHCMERALTIENQLVEPARWISPA